MATHSAQRSPSPGVDRSTLKRAVKKLHKVLEREAGDLRSMVRLARAYRLLADYDRSARWYRLAVGELSARGMGLRALALAKELVAVAPQDEQVLLDMARLYARAPRHHAPAGRVAVPLDDAPAADEETLVGHVPREFTATSVKALVVLDDPAEIERLRPARQGAAPPPPPPEAFRVDPEDQETDDRLLAQAERHAVGGEASSLDDPDPRRRALARAHLGGVPLLSGLPRKAFVRVAEAMGRVDLDDGRTLFEQGDAAASFFILAEGRLSVERRTDGPSRPVALLGPGEVVGIFGLYSGRRRNATARAVGPVVAFEITDEVLAALVREHPATKEVLAAFYRRRLIEGSLALLPILQALPAEARVELAGRFRQQRYRARQTIVATGEVTNAVHLLLSGGVRLTARAGTGSESLELGPGDLFGCVAALMGRPTMSQVECTADTVVATLSHKPFGELAQAHPELLGLPARLAEAGLLVCPTLFVGADAAARAPEP